MSTIGWIVLGIVVVAVFWAISIYNGLVAMRQRTNQAFADSTSSSSNATTSFPIS
jgi:LemA protein